MEINIQQFIDQVMDGRFDQQTVSATADQLKVREGVDAVAQAIQQNRLAQFEWQVTVPNNDQLVSVRLETSVINLPFANAKTISKILNVDETAAVNVYLVCETPDLNRSGLRIDKLASATALVDDPASVTSAAQQWISDKFTAIQASLAAQKEDQD